MKELNEKEFQRLLDEQFKEVEKQGLHNIEEDADLYRLLFTALADEPTVLQNNDLADMVVKQIKINEQKAETLRYSMIIAAVLIAGITVAYFSLHYINPAVLKSTLIFMATYKWIFIFFLFCFGLIEIADKNLVKRKLVSG
jgi:uncharacterized membrane protein